MMFKPLFSGGASGDYLRLECSECNDRCEFAFLGFDPSIPLGRVTCPNHGVLWEGKIDGYDIVATHEAIEQGEKPTPLIIGEGDLEL